MSTDNKSFSKRVGILLALPITFGLVGLAMAHPRGGGEGPSNHNGPTSAKMQTCRAEHHAKMLAKVDANKDGEVSAEERRVAHKARRAEKLASYDTDQDGSLSEAELSNARHDRMVRVFENLDTDSNAEVSAAEAEASCSPVGRAFETIDADSSGAVTWSEFEEASKKFMKHGRRGKRHAKRGGRGRRGMKRGGGESTE